MKKSKGRSFAEQAELAKFGLIVYSFQQIDLCVCRNERKNISTYTHIHFAPAHTPHKLAFLTDWQVRTLCRHTRPSSLCRLPANDCGGNGVYITISTIKAIERAAVSYDSSCARQPATASTLHKRQGSPVLYGGGRWPLPQRVLHHHKSHKQPFMLLSPHTALHTLRPHTQAEAHTLRLPSHSQRLWPTRVLRARIENGRSPDSWLFTSLVRTLKMVFTFDCVRALNRPEIAPNTRPRSNWIWSDNSHSVRLPKPFERTSSEPPANLPQPSQKLPKLNEWLIKPNALYESLWNS